MVGSKNDLCFLTISEASSLIKNRKLSPVELTRAFLERIDAVDRKVRSYVTLLPEVAMAEARTAEAEIIRGDYRGPLHGIPLAHKDLYDTKGVRTTAQSKVYEHRVPTEDATVIERFRGAGSVLLGKLAMNEFAMGGPQSKLFDYARNPWNLDYSPGGSSSGSGAAVAGGLCMGAMGSDTGGSIRGPAALCGIVGLKPTYGLISRYGVIPLSWTLDFCGPMTRTVEDNALMLQAVAGYDPKDPTSSHAPVPDYVAALKEDIKGLIIGVPKDYCFNAKAGVNPEVVAGVEKALQVLEELGARVEEVTIPCLEYARVANIITWLSEGFAYHLPNLQSQPQNYGETFLSRLYLGGLFTAADSIQAQRSRGRMKKEFAQVFQRADLIIMPTTRQGHQTFEELMQEGAPVLPMMAGSDFTAVFNETGMPAMAVPCGFDGKGLPLSFQIAGKPFDEPTVFRAAYTYQQHTRWYERRPPI